MSKHKIEKSKSSETRSVGFAHKSSPKFQTTSFSCHYRGQSPRYNVHRRRKWSSEKEGIEELTVLDLYKKNLNVLVGI